MAQYLGLVEGSRGPATRLGGKASGLRVEANGWACGIEVDVKHEDGHDVFYVTLTGGSGCQRPRRPLLTVYDDGTARSPRVCLRAG